MSLINRIAHDFNRAFSMLEEPLFTATRRFPTLPSSLINPMGVFRPSVDVAETEKNYVVEAEVPGMKKEDLSVEFLNDDTLILKGKVEKVRGDAGDNEGLRTIDTTKAEGDTAGKSNVSDVVETTNGTSANPIYWSNERMIGSFQRSFQFPGRIDTEHVKANYKDGVLYLTIPKSELQTKKVNID